MKYSSSVPKAAFHHSEEARVVALPRHPHNLRLGRPLHHPEVEAAPLENPAEHQEIGGGGGRSSLAGRMCGRGTRVGGCDPIELWSQVAAC